MGRQRTIDDAEFWRSLLLANCSHEEKSVLQYLLTSPFSNIIGVYPIVLRIATSEMGWDTNQLLLVLERLVKLKLISFDEQTGFIWVRIWWYHNRLKAAFDGNVKKMAYSQLRKVPDRWLTEVQEWIAFHDERGVFVPIGSPFQGASEDLGRPQPGATPNRTTNINSTTTYTADSSNGGGGIEPDLETLVDAAVWAAAKNGGINNEAGYRSAIKARIQQNGPSAEDLLTLTVWRAEQVKLQEQGQARQRLERQAEEDRSAHARDAERINAAFNMLGPTDQALTLQGFQEHVTAANPLVFSLLKKQGLKSPVVQAAFTEYLRTIPNRISETTAA